VTSAEPAARQGRRGRRILLAILAIVGVVLAIGIGVFLWWAQPQPLLPEATAALSSSPGAEFTQGADGRLTYMPTGSDPTTGLVLYPGGKVPAAGYAPTARAIAEAGYLVSVVPVPFNLAVFDIGAAAAVIEDHPEIERWVVGGHSLGGSMAAQFISGNPGLVDGLALWASWSAADLSDEDLTALTTWGTLDNAASSITSTENIGHLGTSVTAVPIEGGNHEQMGWYTGQPDDPPATITREAQQEQLVAATIGLLESVAAETDVE
jgi:hypothetical protein